MSWKQWNIGEVVEAGDFQSLVQDQVVQTYADAAARGSALGTAVSEGMVAYTSDNDTLSVYNGSQWGQVAQAISPNYIINGGFDIWQRGTSFTPPSISAQFNADRWYVERLTGATISQQAFTPADLTAVGFGEAQFYMRIASAGATSQQILYQKIEDVRTLAGQTVTVSFYAKSATEQEYRVRLTQNFGSGGSADVSTSQTVLTVGTSWARYTSTFTLPSISGKTVGTGSSLLLDIRDPSANAFTLDIWGVQVEAGSVATPFRRNANSIQGELAACERYYQILADGSQGASTFIDFGQYTNSVTVAVMAKFRTVMRAAPSLKVVSGTNYYRIISNSGTDDFNSFSSSSSSSRTIQLFNNSEVSGTAFDVGRVLTNNSAASIAFEAEL